MYMLELYQFNELSAAVQQKLIDRNRGILFQTGDGQDYIENIKEEHRQRLEGIGFRDVAIDAFVNTGAFCTCSGIDIESVLKHYGEYERFQPAIAGYAASIDKKHNVNERLESSVYLNVISKTEDKFVPALSAFIMDMARHEMRKIFGDIKASYNRSRGDLAVRNALADAGYDYTIDGNKVEIE